MWLCVFLECISQAVLETKNLQQLHLFLGAQIFIVSSLPWVDSILEKILI